MIAGLAELRHKNVHFSPDDVHHVTDTYCVSKNSIKPSCAPSRPMPDCFLPPNGAAGSETMPRLNPIMPKSSFSETQQAMPALFGQKLKLLREEVGPHLAHTVAFVLAACRQGGVA